MELTRAASLARDRSTILLYSSVGTVGTELLVAPGYLGHRSTHSAAALSVTPVEYFTEWQQSEL